MAWGGGAPPAAACGADQSAIRRASDRSAACARTPRTGLPGLQNRLSQQSSGLLILGDPSGHQFAPPGRCTAPRCRRPGAADCRRFARSPAWELSNSPHGSCASWAAAGSLRRLRGRWRLETSDWRSYALPYGGITPIRLWGTVSPAPSQSPRRTPNTKAPIIIRFPLDLEQARFHTVEHHIPTWAV